MKEEKLTNNKKKTGLKKEVQWTLMRPDMFAILIMFLYGYSIALLGTGYEYRIFGANITFLILLLIVLLVDLIINLFRMKRDKKNFNNDSDNVEEDPIAILDDLETETVVDNKTDYNEDTDTAYKTMKENKID